MHRFYLPPADCRNPIISLTGREAHHAHHVLRLRNGDRVMVLDGQGNKQHCEVADTKRDVLELKVLDRTSVAPLPYAVTLAQAIPKGKLFEDIIEKATELGVRRIVPLLTQRTVGKFGSEEEKRKLAKWRLVAIEAIKQCGSAWLPHIDALATVEQFAKEQKSIELPFVGSLASNALHPKSLFEDFKKRTNLRPKSVSVAIGPEGDFTAEELKLLQCSGAHPITLGPLVLRTETAAIYCLSIINFELQAPNEL